jgi:hypothetical protein
MSSGIECHRAVEHELCDGFNGQGPTAGQGTNPSTESPSLIANCQVLMYSSTSPTSPLASTAQNQRKGVHHISEAKVQYMTGIEESRENILRISFK